MAYLATFYWGWLLASLLLGLAMGWISVVQHGEGVSKKMTRWLAALAVGAGRRPRCRACVPGRFGYWLDLGLIMFALYLVRLCDRIMAARLGGFAQRAGGVIASMARSAHHHRHHEFLAGFLAAFLAGPRCPGTASRRRVCCKTVLPPSSTPPNMLKKRVLLSSGEFHSGSKRATRGAGEQGSIGGVRPTAVAVGSQFEV